MPFPDKNNAQDIHNASDFSGMEVKKYLKWKNVFR